MSTTLQELARLANVGGDIRYGQEQPRLQQKAENLLSRLTDKAAKKAEGDPKTENFMDFLGGLDESSEERDEESENSTDGA